MGKDHPKIKLDSSDFVVVVWEGELYCLFICLSVLPEDGVMSKM